MTKFTHKMWIELVNYTLQASRLHTAEAPNATFSTDCSGSSMSVYTSASSCFLPPATCSSVTLSPCSADTTAPTALSGLIASAATRAPMSPASLYIIWHMPKAATLLPMEAAAALRTTLPAPYFTLDQEPGSEDTLQQDYCSNWHNSSQNHFYWIRWSLPKTERLTLPRPRLQCCRSLLVLSVSLGLSPFLMAVLLDPAPTFTKITLWKYYCLNVWYSVMIFINPHVNQRFITYIFYIHI